MLKKRILAVVEDTASRRKLVERLGAEGYEVATAYTHTEAARKIKENAVGLVIADMSSPRIDSLGFLTFFKDKNPIGRIIVLSRKPDFSSAQQAMRLYASDYLPDPVSPDLLAASVGRAFFDADKAMARMRAHAAEENLRLKDELEKASLDTITALAGALEARDEYTRGHSARVAEMAVRVGERMHLPEGDLKRLRYGGILHDIGKIGVDRGILNKPSPLTREEFDNISEHTEIGVRIISSVESLGCIKALVRHHHEPYGRLSALLEPDGREFLLVCIIKAADAYDAMVSDRSYRKAMPPEMALGELMNYAGTEFHPRAVEEIAMVVRGEKLAGLRNSEIGALWGRSPIAPGYL